MKVFCRISDELRIDYGYVKGRFLIASVNTAQSGQVYISDILNGGQDGCQYQRPPHLNKRDVLSPTTITFLILVKVYSTGLEEPSVDASPCSTNSGYMRSK